MLSIVIPAFNEAESLVTLHKEIVDALKKGNHEYEVIVVDDGSTDHSWEIIQRLAREDAHIHGIRFRRNFGKTAALSAGFRAAKGDIVMTMDADLQDDPKEIPHFLTAMEEGLDVVCGWRHVRRDPLGKIIPSRVFNWLVNRLMGLTLHDHNCGMKCYRSEIFKEVHLYGELHRFVPVLAAARGWRVGEIRIEHRPRRFGKSKYGIGRFTRGLLDLFTVYFLIGFQGRPQHFLGTAGLLSTGLGVLGLIIVSFLWIITRLDNVGFFPWILKDSNIFERAIDYYALVALLLGVQLLALSFLAALITAHHQKDDGLYAVRERTDK